MSVHTPGNLFNAAMAALKEIDPWINSSVLVFPRKGIMDTYENAAKSDKDLFLLQITLIKERVWELRGIEVITDSVESSAAMIGVIRVTPNKYPYALSDESAYSLFKKRIGLDEKSSV